MSNFTGMRMFDKQKRLSQQILFAMLKQLSRAVFVMARLTCDTDASTKKTWDMLSVSYTKLGDGHNIVNTNSKVTVKAFLKIPKGPADSSKEPDPGGSDQQIVQMQTEYRKTDLTVRMDKLYIRPIFHQARPYFFRE